jgi:hypothetical protein
MPRKDEPKLRSTVTDDEFGGFRITIPAPAGFVRIGCLGLALSAGLLVVICLYLGSGMSMADDWKWIAVSLLGLALSSWLLIYGLTGREIIIIDEKTLVLRREGLLGCKSESFELAETKNLRPVRSADIPGDRPSNWNKVAFDYRGKPQFFADGLSETEVLRLVKTIRQRYAIKDDLDDAKPLPVEL